MIRLENLTKRFEHGGEQLTVFENLTIEVGANAVTAILGPSGCGKTTLLRLIAGLEEPSSGAITFDEPDHRVGMVFQEYTAFPWRTVAGNLAFALDSTQLNAADHAQRITYWLAKTGLSSFRTYYPGQLSGGMKQRLAFARCLATSPTVLLLDEPFGSIDAISRDRMVHFTEQLLPSLEASVILVTHSIREAILLADRIIVLSTPPSRAQLDFAVEAARPRHVDYLWSDTARNIEETVRRTLISENDS